MIHTPTPEAIEAVIDAALDLYHWEAFQSQAGDIAEAVEDVLRKAVANAAPISAAEALRDAADAVESAEMGPTERDVGAYGSWLRERAATIEGASQ